MDKFKLLIPTAGKGTRAKLDFPKTLYPVEGIPILIRIINQFHLYDKNPSLVVSKLGEEKIQKVLNDFSINAELLFQNKPKGMGDAVLTFLNSIYYNSIDHIILVWGDIPFLQPTTIKNTIERHINNSNDFTFPTIFTVSPYTIIERYSDGSLKSVIETREDSRKNDISGEREIGFFIFKSNLVLEMLSKNLEGKNSLFTKEHGFLYIIKHLVKFGYKVEALPIAKKEDTISLNKIEDLRR